MELIGIILYQHYRILNRVWEVDIVYDKININNKINVDRLYLHLSVIQQ